ncbi:hypothetical protein C8R46DRAFT_1268658, partial [Mycena filopes]
PLAGTRTSTDEFTHTIIVSFPPDDHARPPPTTMPTNANHARGATIAAHALDAATNPATPVRSAVPVPVPARAHAPARKTAPAPTEAATPAPAPRSRKPARYEDAPAFRDLPVIGKLRDAAIVDEMGEVMELYVSYFLDFSASSQRSSYSDLRVFDKNVVLSTNEMGTQFELYQRDAAQAATSDRVHVIVAWGGRLVYFGECVLKAQYHAQPPAHIRAALTAEAEPGTEGNIVACQFRRVGYRGATGRELARRVADAKAAGREKTNTAATAEYTRAAKSRKRKLVAAAKEEVGARAGKRRKADHH